MQTKRIICPQCKAILDVRNSKNEEVKQITCPSCKTLLQVKFAPQQDPIEAPTFIAPSPSQSALGGETQLAGAGYAATQLAKSPKQQSTAKLFFHGVGYELEEGQKTDIAEMTLMSRCKHHILANSSFSWWAAWLNDSPEKIASLQIKENGKIFFTRPFIQLKKEYDYFALDRLDRQNALFLTFFPDCGNGYGARRISDRFTKVHKRDILILFSGAIVFIWFVLAIQFESCRKPFLILCTVPMGISGSLLALFVTGKSLNISSVLGLMILSGTGVNSGILILSDVVRGIPVAQAALSRLRTVCLTLLSTVVVLLPVALFDSNPIQNCASISLLGGLVFGTAVLFAFIPVLIKEESSE